MDNLRIGLVGYGRFGKIHADAIASIRGAEISCICVGSEKSKQEVKASLGVDVYSDFDEFLEKGKMDAVDIVSPNYLHAQQAMKAMAREKDIFIEKPIATNAGEIQKLHEQSKKKDSSSIVQVGFEYRYAPFYKSFKSSLENHVIEHPTFAKIESWRAPFRTGSGGWRYEKSKVGHHFLEEAVHYFDLAIWYFGMPEKVSGFTDSPRTWGDGKFGTASALLDYAAGLRVMILDTINGLSEHVFCTLSGEGAMIGMTQSELDGSSASGWIKTRGRDGTTSGEPVKVLGEVENVRLEIQDFADAVESGRAPTVTLEDGLRAMSVNLGAIAAIQSGGVVRLG